METIRREGTHAIAPQHLASWNLTETGTGTLIGTVSYHNGTVFHLSVGPYEHGTSYPTKFGAQVTSPSGEKLVWFDWTVGTRTSHRHPHVHFSHNPKQRYSIYDDSDWQFICTELETMRQAY